MGMRRSAQVAMVSTSAATLQTIVNSAAETTILSYTWASPISGTGFRIALGGTYLNNSAGAQVIVMKVKLGATTIWSATTAAVATSASRRGWQLLGEGRIAATQGVSAEFQYSPAAANGVAGTPAVAFGSGTATESLASSLTLLVTAQLVADPLIELVVGSGRLTLMA